MAEHTFLTKLYDEFLKSDNADNRADKFVEWADAWLVKNSPVGTGFADGTSAITVRFQNGDQYPLSKQGAFVVDAGRGVQITGQASKSGKGGVVTSAAVPITGN